MDLLRSQNGAVVAGERGSLASSSAINFENLAAFLGFDLSEDAEEASFDKIAWIQRWTGERAGLGVSSGRVNEMPREPASKLAFVLDNEELPTSMSVP